jgi:hypothetical protein
LKNVKFSIVRSSESTGGKKTLNIILALQTTFWNDWDLS